MAAPALTKPAPPAQAEAAASESPRHNETTASETIANLPDPEIAASSVAVPPSVAEHSEMIAPSTEHTPGDAAATQTSQRQSRPQPARPRSSQPASTQSQPSNVGTAAAKAAVPVAETTRRGNTPAVPAAGSSKKTLEKPTSAYRSSMVRFLAWFVVHRPALVPQVYRDAHLAGCPISEAALQTRFRPLVTVYDPSIGYPIDFDHLKATDFSEWVSTQLIKSNGKLAKYLSLYQHRASLAQFFRLHNRSMTQEFAQELGMYYRKLRKRLQDQEVKTPSGSDAGHIPDAFNHSATRSVEPDNSLVLDVGTPSDRSTPRLVDPDDGLAAASTDSMLPRRKAPPTTAPLPTPESTPRAASAPSPSLSNASNRDVHPERQPLDFSSYVTLCDALLSLPDEDALFARAYLILWWNLMCRAPDPLSIRLQHLEWSNDALRVSFARANTRRLSPVRRYPRHVYANPINRSVCPILSLAMFWACHRLDSGDHDADPDDNTLFPGWTDTDQAHKCLDRLFKIDSAARAIENRIYYDTPTLFDAYSVRRGAAVFTCSGSTECPSSVQIGLRSGWALGDPIRSKSLIGYADPGDQYVGRTVSGLPIHHAEFATLPPHFESQSHEAVRNGVAIVFPNFPARLSEVAAFFLASLVHHADYLRSTVPSTHPILRTPLFENPGLLSSLSPLVRVGVGGQRHESPDDRMVPTGIPPHVAIMCEMRSLSAKTTQIAERMMAAVNALKTTQDDIMNQVTSRLDARTTASSQTQVTHEGIVNIVQDSFREVGLFDMVSPDAWASIAAKRTSATPSADVDTNSAVDVVVPGDVTPSQRDTVIASNGTLAPHTADAHEGWPLSYWGNERRWVPADFLFPEDVSPAHMWNLWKLGNPETKLVPFQLLKSHDLPSARSKKQLIDLQYLMGVIERRASELGVLKPRMTVEEVAQVFEKCASAIAVDASETTASGSRKRQRSEEPSWTTVVHLLRTKERGVENSRVVTGGDSWL